MTTTTVPTRSTTTTTADKLLTCGLVAGPLYMAVYLAQAFTRENFDLTRHPASLLSNGGPGWIQTLNFVVAGLLCVAAGVGLRRTVSGRGSTWGPRLVAQYGVGLLLAAVFRADPAAGFPAGTPEDYAEISWHGTADRTRLRPSRMEGRRPWCQLRSGTSRAPRVRAAITRPAAASTMSLNTYCASSVGAPGNRSP
jgi:hypothetical protein